MAQQTESSLRILRRKQVEDRIGLSRSSIYAKTTFNPRRPKEFDPDFPRPISLGNKAVGWIEAEIEGWISRQIEKSRKAA